MSKKRFQRGAFNLFHFAEKTKSNNAPKSRALKLEALEERQLLAVSFEEFAAVGAASELGVSVLDPNEPIELALEQDEAQTWVVSSTADSNVLGTLRYALASAQDGDTITFDAGLKGQTIVLSGSQLEITKSITIDASALLDANDPTPQITINANRASRVFQVAASVEATFKGLTISGGRVYRNDYDGYGGGVNVGNYASATFVNCVITGNEAGCPNAGWGAYGGGIYFGNYTNGTFENCVISNNKALETNSGSEAYGGGIAFGANAKIASFVNCLIADNIAQGSGGAYGARYGGGHGGAFFFDSSSQLDARFVNCAVVNNSANYVDGRMYNSRYTGDSIVFQNSIVVLDNASTLADWSQLMGAASAFNSLSNFSAWANASDPDVVNYAYDPNSPLFVDAENADYRIPTNSQAVDRGNNSYILLDKDLAGSARVFNSVVDLGPYESFVSSSEPLAAPTLAISQTGDASPVATIGEVFGASQYVLECATDSAFNNVVKTWIFDGSGAKTLEDAPAGAIRYFRVKATALDRYDSNYATASAFISNPALVVSSTSDDANVPGTLRYALANSRDGDTITFDAALKGQTIVLSGSQLEVTKSITIDASALLDANDSTPQITIDANRASRVFQIAAGVAATFNGLTITNGHTYNDIGSGGGVYVLDCASATFVNCAITGNEAGCPNPGWGAYGGGVAFAVYSSGSFENCVITNNRAFDTTSGGEGYGGGVCFRENAKIASFTNCLIANNVAQGSNQANNRPGGGHGAAVFFTESNRLEASFVNCTIANNSANNRDGSMWDPRYTGDGITFQNTIVSLNDASALSDWSQTMGVASAFNTLSEFTAWSNAADPGVVNYALDQYARLFVDAENADYHLVRESVAIDKGDNECVASDRDLDGGARIVGTAVDLGAYEYVPSEAKTWTVTSAEDSVNVEGTLRYAIANAKDGETIVFDSALKGQTIVLSGSQLEITKSITIDASALLDADDPTPQITIDANRASRVFNVAAGVEATFNGLTITNGYLYVNNVGGWGGGVFVGAHASAMFVNCAITGNEAGCPNAGWSSYGGGVCFSEYASGTFENCVITNNRAFDTTSGGEGYGGAVYFGTNSKIASFTNCLIANNVAQGSNQVNNRPGGGHGAAFFFAPSDQLEASFVNCTIANNSANYRDGSMWDPRYTGDSITFQNSVIYLNNASALSDWAQIMGAASAFNTLSEFTAWANASDPGVVNYALDQYARLFVDAENADYHLVRESVAIDKGDNECVASDRDLDGGARIVGTSVDLGAYEYVPRDVTTWTVNSLLDDPDLAGTLRYSLANAKDGDSIVFDPALKGQTIVLSGSQLEVVKSIAIDASSLLDANDPTPQVTIDANRASRVFQVAAGVEVTFKGLTITNGYLNSGNEGGWGGGVHVGAYASATFENCYITGNNAGCSHAGWASYGGGVVFCDYASGAFENCVISNNKVWDTELGGEGWGGGVAFYANARSALFANCVISGNAALGSSSAYGAGIGGGHGGGVFFGSSSELVANFVNCTVASNRVNYSLGAGGVDVSGEGEVSFQNSIVLFNEAPNTPEIYGSASAFNTLSDFSAWANASTPGVVNYVYDPNSPLFADPENGDYRLPADSQAVDRGNNALVSADSDITGAQRVFNGTVDLGPYEFVLADAEALDSPTLTLSQTEARTLVATIGNVLGAERYVLELATDSAFQNVAISQSYSNSGAQTLSGLSSGATYYARVKATALYRLDSNYAVASVALENMALVVSSTLDDANVSGTLRYAIANAQDGDTITFAPEMKGQTIVLSGSPLEITKSINVDASNLLEEGSTTPQITIDANRSSRALIIRSQGSRIEGLAFTNAYENGWGAGVYIGNEARATLVNCSITNNESRRPEYDTYGAGLYIGVNAGGSFENCVIANNFASAKDGAYGGGVASYYSAEISFTNCVISNNSVSSSSARAFGGGVSLYNSAPALFTNCVISDNVADGGNGIGGGVWFDTETHIYGTFVNCTVANNWADYGGGVLTGHNARSSITFQNSIVALNEEANPSGAPDDNADMAGWASAFNTLSSYTMWRNRSDSGVVNYVYDPNSPLFVAPENGDYRLVPNSQALDRGNNAYISLEKDLLGSARVDNGFVDLGPYELVPSTADALAVPTLALSDFGDASLVATIGAVSSANRYVLELATDSAFENIIKTWTYHISGAKTLSDLPRGATYYLRVKAIGPNRLDSDYATESFEIANSALFVTSTSDANVLGTLRYAIANAQDGDTITFAPNMKGQTIVLSGSPLEITKSINVDASSLLEEGSSTPQITIDANCSSRVLIVRSRGSRIEGLAFTNGYENGWGAGVYIGNEARATLVNCSITNNESRRPEYDTYGAGLYIGVNAGGSFENCVIANNIASAKDAAYGAGIAFYQSSGATSFINCVVSGNVASANDSQALGGGVYIDAPSSGSQLSVSFVNCTVAGNDAPYGAGVYKSDSNVSLTFQNSIVASNKGDREPVVGSYASTDSLIGVNPGFVCPPIFENGALTNADSIDLRLASYSTYIDYPQEGYLGAYEFAGERTPLTCNVVTTLDDEFDLTNDATSLREALYLTPNDTKIVFAPGLSGTIYLDPTLEITDSPQIDGNGRVALDGRGANRVLLVWNGAPRFEGLTITNGRVEGSGGGVYVRGGANFAFVNCSITENEAFGSSSWIEGGGVYISNNSGGTFENCVISSNIVNSTSSSSSDAANGGGVTCYDAAPVAFVNCLISDNVASGGAPSGNWNNGGGNGYAGGVYFNISSDDKHIDGTFVNCTIANNTAEYGGGVVTGRDARSAITFQNSIVALNQSTLKSEWNDIVVHSTAFNTLSSSSDYWNTWYSGGEFYVYAPSSPLFVDPENGDYRLAPNSQAIDRGNNAYVSLDKDLAGATRIVNGVVDLGPYESGDSNALDVPALTISQIGEISFVATIGAVANADRYVLEYATSSNFQGSTIATYDTAGAKPIYGLTSATTYYVRVKALSAGELDDSPWSSVLEATTTIPAPSLFVLSKTTNSITLAIGEVANAARYVLAIATDPSFASSTNQNLTSAGTKTISGLASATTYYFRVMATGTGLGSSAWSRTVNAKTDVSTPTLAFVSKTATSVSLTIGEIANAARYVVEFSTSSDFAMSVGSRSFNVSGDATIGDLDPATTYYFRVKAVMSDSSESSPSGVVEVETDFGSPIFSLGEKTASTVALTLTGVGASPKLEIWYWSVASPEIRTQMIATSANILVDYLRPATTYSFRARAIDENEAPLSDWSYLETTTSLETPALYVLPDAATANSISLVVGKVDGVTGYSIQYSTDPAFSVSDPSTQTASYNSFGAKQISGLIPATEYYFRVKATSQEFDESAWSTEDVKETTKLAVSTLEFVAKTADSVTISLGAVENAIEYTVVYALDSQFSSGKKSETFYAPGLQTISGLNPATEYYFYVVASANDGYESPRSGSISAATNLATPSLAVVGQSVDAIDFSIVSVERAGSYVVQWSTDSAFASILGEKTIEATEAQTLSDSIPNLASGTTYYLRVKAISDERDPSEWSADPVAANVVFPSPALGLVAKDATSATLTIGSVPNAGLYELQCSTDSRFDNSAASITTRAYTTAGIKKIDALTSATTYYFRLRATSASGEVASEWTALGASTNLATPSLAVKSVTSVSATLSIGAVDRARNYVVELSNDPAFSDLDPSTTTRVFDEPGDATINGLTAGNAYYFRVKATSDSFDESAWSTEDVRAIATIEAPVLSAIQPVDASTINLTLDYPDGFAGSFVLQYSTDPKFEYADAPVTTRAFASPGTKAIGDLKAASTYYFRVKASAEGIDDSAWSNVLDASTCLPTPNFSFSYASDSSVILTIESIPEARKYEVFYADFQFDANASPLPEGVTRLVVVPNGSQTISRQISGLASDSPYYFYVKASVTEPALYGPSPKKSSAPRTSALPLYLDSSLGRGVCNIVRNVLAAPSLCVEKSTARSVTLSINESNFGSAFVAPLYVVQYSTSPNFPEGDPSRDSTWNGELVATETGGWVQTEFENLTFDNLAPGTTYYFRIKAKSSTLGVSDSVWSEGFDVFETTAIGLGAPTLAVAATTANSATINIGTIQGCEIYEVEYGTDPEFKVAERRNFSSSGLGTIQNLAPATTYYFRVRATGSGRDASLWSGVPAVANTALETPTLLLEAISPDSATIRLGQSGRAQLYAVEFGTSPSFDDASVRFYNAPGVKTISGLTPGATYYFRVRANATGYSDSAISATVEAKTALPTPKISAFVVENDSLSFNLEPLAGSEGYFVQYGTDRNFASDYTTELFYETSGEKRIEGLLPGTLYYLRVKSNFTGEDFTGDSDWVVLPATTGFAAPTLSATVVSSSSISVNIGASTNAKSYVVEYGTEPKFVSATSKTFATPGEKTISGLDPDSTYYFRVKASAPGRGESPLSTVVNATTESVDDSRLVVYRTEDNATKTGTLRNAIARANDGETIFIDLEPGETIELSAELIVDKAITIDASACWDDAANAPGITITTGGASRVFTLTASATLVGLTITGGKATEGGGILVAEGADATLTRCVVTGNEAYAEPASTSDYNPVKAWGGGISARGNLTLDRCVVVDNVASTPEHSRSAYCYGGGIYATGELNARDSVIARNQTIGKAQYNIYSHGAGVYASGAATLVNCDVLANEASFLSNNPYSTKDSYGGGVFVVRSLTVDNSRFSDNIAPHKGGAIYASNGSTVSIANDAIVEGNRSNSFGGGIYSEGDLTVSEGCALIANQSESGGAIYSGGKLTLSDAVVRDNVAESGNLAMGGGLYLSGDAIVENVSIYNNAARVPGSTTGASSLGGGVYANSSRDVALTNCSIVDNSVETTSSWTATAQGGGVYSNFVGANLTVTNCEISGNSASTSTTGSSQYATATSQGGGIYAARALSLVNSTVVANSVDASGAFVSTAGDGAYLQRYAQTDAFSLDNSIVILNGAAEDDLRRSDVETVVLGRNSFSSFDEWTNKTQPGVVNYGYSRLEPLFEDFEGGDYRPASNSQLVDRGDPASFPSGLDVDLDGNDRFYRTIDVGAYERVGDKEPRLASPEIELERDGDELAVNIVAKDDYAERYVLDYAVLSTRSGGSTLSYETISFDSPGVKTLPGVSADATIRYRVRAEALGRVSSLWTRDLTGAEAASAKWVPAAESEPDSLEPNDSRETATALGTLASQVSYELALSSASDVDWLALETVATGGEENFVRVEYARSNDGTALILDLYDARGRKVATSSAATGVESVSFNNLPAGKYWLKISNPRPDGRAADYRLTIDPPVAIETKLPRPVVSVASSASGATVRLETVEGASGYLVQYGTDPDFVDAVEKTYLSGGAKTLSGLAPSTKYYVRVKALANAPTDPSDAQEPLPNEALATDSDWTLATVTTDANRDRFEPNDLQEEARDLGAVSGEARFDSLNLHSGTDVDWFKFEPTPSAGTELSIALTGSTSRDANLVAELFDAQGARVAASSGSSGVETISVPRGASEYWLRVVNRAPRPSAASYSLQFAERAVLPAPAISVGDLSIDSATLVIGSVSEATRYLLQYDVAPDFSSPTERELTESGSVSIGELLPETTYYFRVKAIAEGRPDSDWSETSATTPSDLEEQLDPPTITGTTPTKVAVTFKINAPANAISGTSYFVEYGNDPDFASPATKSYATAGTKTINGLAFGATYYFRVKATASGFLDSEWTTFEAKTKNENFSTAPTLASTAIGTNSFAVEIGSVENAKKYVLEYATSANFANAASIEFASPGAQTIPNLASGTTYYFRVKATAEHYDDSAWSEAISATTLDPSGAALDVPTITALSGTKTAIVVKFDAIDGAQKYVFEYSTDSKFSNSVAKPYSTAGSKTITGLTTGTWYYVRMKATATGRPDSAYTEVRKIYTGGSYAMPSFTFSAVKTAVVLNIKPGKIDANQGAPEKYVVEYSESPDFSNARTKTVAQGVEADGTLKPCKPTISGLTFGTAYYFRVKATGSLGNDSAWYANNGKPIAAGQLAVPTFFTSKIGTDFINVRCYNSAGASGFEVMFSTSSDFANPRYAQCSASSGTVALTGLDPNTKYYYKVRALGDNVSRVDSTWSVIVNNATTKPATTSSALLDEDSDFENYFEDDDLDAFWDVLAKSVAK